MENQNQRPNNTDEIDISQFFRWIGTGFSRFGNSILFGMAGLRNLFFQNRLFFFGLIVIGLILGGLYSELLKKKYYKSTMVLSCDYLNTQILKNTIDKFNLLAAEKDTEGLQKQLNIDANTASNIQEFSFQSFVSEDEVVDTEILKEQLNNLATDKKDLVEKVMERIEIQNKNAYEISVYVYDPEIVKPLETGFVNYFNNNNYIRRRIEITKANLIERKNKLTKEMNKLDSLKSVLFQNYQTLGQKSRGSNNVILGEESLANPLDVFKQDLEMHKELQKVEKDLYLSPDFEIVDGFTTFKQPESLGLAQILVISFFLSILMGYLILGAWRFDRMLANYDRDSAD